MKTTTTLGNARPLLLALCLWLLCAGSARSQEFTVSSFRLLPNDVSAFVNSVRDLNDEACALVKVEAPSDFAFSTPLGIVKRKDEVGEIWLYLPPGHEDAHAETSRMGACCATISWARRWRAA